MSFHDDFKELTSTGNFAGFILGYLGIIFTSEDKFTVAWQVLLITIICLILYFVMRWIFVYRIENKKKKRKKRISKKKKV